MGPRTPSPAPSPSSTTAALGIPSIAAAARRLPRSGIDRLDSTMRRPPPLPPGAAPCAPPPPPPPAGPSASVPSCASSIGADSARVAVVARAKADIDVVDSPLPGSRPRRDSSLPAPPAARLDAGETDAGSGVVA
jgi:hypothetical protein